MEHQLWRAIVAIVMTLGKPRKRRDGDFTDHDIVATYYWSVVHDRPTGWACRRNNWPVHLRRRRLPTPPTMSRRLRSRRVVALLDALERRAVAPKEPGLFWIIDGKPLVIGGCSKDRQAGYGRAARSKARGYKVHAVVDAAGGIAEWRLAPMNKDERVMAERLLKRAPIRGYVAADSNFDSNVLHEVCAGRGLILIAPRREPGTGLGHRKHSAGRRRSMELTENPHQAFGRQALKDRNAVERVFGNWTSWGGGLTCLPPWVRTHRRVKRWVQAKLVLTAINRAAPSTTCAA